MVELIITEKPSSAKKLAEALADTTPVKKKSKKSSYYELTHNKHPIIVTSAVGHLYGLVESEKKGWTYPVFDIKWEESYKNSKNLDYVKDYVYTIKTLSKQADEFTVACDYDVEGEVIGLNVVRFACKQKDANRMKFSTLTKGDLIKSYENKIKHLDWGQAFAGETRHKLDWFYGINLSRALTASVKAAGSFKVMSSGRVQGPALKLLVDREKEIQAFVPEPFWLIRLDGTYVKSPVEAWHQKDKIFDEKVVTEILTKVQGAKEATVTSVKRTQRNQAPPFPFDLTTLQSEAYNHFKITPKETLSHAQSLYLMGVTSYPRTSSQKLDPKLGFQKILSQLSSQAEYKDLADALLKKKQLNPNNGKKTDPAHPAIYPTGLRPKELKPREDKVYDLIVKRFLATFADPAVRETMEVSLDVNQENFITKGTRTLQENWHVFYKPYVKLEEVSLPDMKENDVVSINKIEKMDKETQPPKRFNQSSIIKELEKRNLGTKATRADILDRLFQRGYVEGVKITVTQLGIETIGVLERYAPEITDEKLTADFEEDMDKIRQGKEKQENVLEKAKKFLTKLLGDFKKKEKVIGEDILKSLRETIDASNYMGPCPKCDGRLMVRRGKFGRFVGCDKYPDCKTIVNVPKTGILKFTGKVDDETGFPIIEAGTGRKKATVTLAENKKDDTPVEKKYPEQDMVCPTCKEGKMILRKSFYGEFLGCSGYPKCQTMMKIVKGVVDVANPIVKKPGDKKKKVVKKKVAKKKKVKK
ncbi:DNA topoisomerase I [Candidatus Woesearchaeota archaeon]|nr:DNA topoisomerase I [Candidatus Woesearchaeota archaeon]MBT5397062.1 DNA topoisomerase I [Candidatus Woesearchaeota archaeon]MBT7762462.1 DNA topoisomerase I [Candidatus Woesearchaeota archaeon]